MKIENKIETRGFISQLILMYDLYIYIYIRSHKMTSNSVHFFERIFKFSIS